MLAGNLAQTLDPCMRYHFEQLRALREYGTPVALFVYARLMAWAAPLLCAPYFAHLACPEDKNNDDDCGFGQTSGYIGAVVFSLILGILLNVVETLADPFSTLVDSIDLNLWDEFDLLS